MVACGALGGALKVGVCREERVTDSTDVAVFIKWT
jgi:hypothetical protein